MADAPKTITLSQYVAGQGQRCLIDLQTCPFHMRTDYERRNANVEAGAALCETCDGTGNNLFSMHQRCPGCGGSGVATYHLAGPLEGQDAHPKNQR